MKNTLLIISVAVAMAANVSAESLTPAQTLSRFRSSSRESAVARSFKPSDDLKLKATEGNLYVFAGKTGFVVMPSEDYAPAVLAYSDNGDFDPDSNPGLRYWMDYYNEQLEYVKNHPELIPGLSKAAHVQRAEISPLTTTKWNQEYPYNILCPKVDGHETVTGCVATAMAQVMKYHNYPEHGKGTHSYYWRPGEEELSFDYETTPFKWDEMTDTYDKESSEESREAVAELMLACGVSVDMHYEPGDSGAATMKMGASLIDIFGYSKSLWMPQRAYYGYDEWEDMIYADLAEGLPVLYSGQGTAGGHQFICDGYKDDGFFHFNWGWGGLSNGYFLLTALNPDDLGVGGGAGGFNTSQIITLGVRPGKEGDKPTYIFYNPGSFTTDADKVKEGDEFTCEGQYFNYSLSSMPEGSHLGLKFVSEDTAMRFVESYGVGGMRPDDGLSGLRVRFPKLPDGTYKITPALYVDGKWSDIRTAVGMPQMITATVSDGTATFANETAASVYVTDIRIPAKIFRDFEFPMSFEVENISDAEFYGKLTPMLLDSNGDVASKSVFRPVDVLAGEKERVGDYIGKFAPLADNSLPADTYTMVIRDEAGKNVGGPIEVKLEVNTDKTEIEVSDLVINDKEPVVYPESVRAEMKVTCTSGVFFGPLRMDVFHADGGYAVYSTRSASIYLAADETGTAEMEADMSHLEDGDYMAIVYQGSEAKTGRVYFRIDREAVGVSGLESDNESGAIYDLNGMRLTGVDRQTIYIKDGKKMMERR